MSRVQITSIHEGCTERNFLTLNKAPFPGSKIQINKHRYQVKMHLEYRTLQCTKKKKKTNRLYLLSLSNSYSFQFCLQAATGSSNKVLREGICVFAGSRRLPQDHETVSGVHVLETLQTTAGCEFPSFSSFQESSTNSSHRFTF